MEFIFSILNGGLFVIGVIVVAFIVVIFSVTVTVLLMDAFATWYERIRKTQDKCEKVSKMIDHVVNFEENLENQSKIKEYEDKLKHLDKGVVHLIKAKTNEQSPQPINYSYDEIEEALSQFYEKKIKEYKDKIKNR